MGVKPVIFFCSPSESKSLMEALVPLVCANAWALPQLWTQSFDPGVNYLEALLEQVGKASFAVIVDDLSDSVVSRGEQRPCLRDNSTFELGALIARLGAERVLLVHPSRAQVRLPSDYAGYETLKYETGSAEPAQYLTEVGLKIRRRFQSLNAEQAPTAPLPPDAVPSLSRMIIHTCREAEQQLDWYQELWQSLERTNPTLNSSMLYYGPGCAPLWAQSNIDADAYRDLRNAFELTLLQMLDPFLSSRMSVIDLGIGDFQKGNRLLQHLLDHDEVQRIHYYPFDISYEMLTMALNARTGHVADVLRRIYQSGGAVTGINGRFADLYQYRDLFAGSGESLFMLLGNTLGNELDEHTTLADIRRAMAEGDILFVELQLAEEQPKSDDEITAGIQPLKYFYASPFITLGVSPEDIELTVRSDPREAAPRGIQAISYAISCRLKEPWRNPYPPRDARSKIRIPQRAIQVYMVRKYEPESIKQAFRQAGFEILADRISPVQKKSDRRFLFLAARLSAQRRT